VGSTEPGRSDVKQKQRSSFSSVQYRTSIIIRHIHVLHSRPGREAEDPAQHATKGFFLVSRVLHLNSQFLVFARPERPELQQCACVERERPERLQYSS